MMEVVTLAIDLFERLGILAILFFLMMRFELFQGFLTGKASHGGSRQKLFLSVCFGAAAVFATYCGFEMHGAIANLRTVPVVIASILGGPLVGLFAGLIAGVHRYFYDLGGVTSLSCAIATPLAGIVAGLLYRRLQRRRFDWLATFLIGMVAEAIKMVLILLLARPYEAALEVVSSIGFPSVLANAFGVAVLVELIAVLVREQERAMAQQAQTTLNIAFRTLPYLRQGLDRNSAAETVRIIREMTGIDAVSLSTDREMLAHEGVEAELHAPGERTHSQAASRAFDSGAVVIAMTREEIGSPCAGCRLGSVIAVPLRKGGRSVAVMQLYRLKEQGISRLDEELANGLAHLFSNQLELDEIELQRKLTAEAEIKALQAQINPHFLFNAISTINSHIRTDPQQASFLLVKLADFFRKNITPGASLVQLSVELEHCEAYLAIEKARFEERLSVVYQIDEAALSCYIPPLILQPLLENSVRHGILPREEGGMVRISARKEEGHLAISVRDDGVGIPRERLACLLSANPDTKGDGGGLGLALRNVNGRLSAMYGKESALTIESNAGEGTTVRFLIPVSA